MEEKGLKQIKDTTSVDQIFWSLSGRRRDWRSFGLWLHRQAGSGAGGTLLAGCAAGSPAGGSLLEEAALGGLQACDMFLFRREDSLTVPLSLL